MVNIPSECFCELDTWALVVQPGRECSPRQSSSMMDLSTARPLSSS